MVVHFVGAVEFTDCIFAEWGDPTLNEGPGYDTKSDYDAPVTLELWRMRRTPSGSLLPGVVAPDTIISMGQIELFEF